MRVGQLSTRTGAIGDDYVLGIGDQVQVSFRGATNRTQAVLMARGPNTRHAEAGDY